MRWATTETDRGGMAEAEIDGADITSWEAFHTVSAKTLGFPNFYGRNMDAWIDCLTYLYEGDGMSRFKLDQGEALTIRVSNARVWRQQAPETLDAFVDCTAFVNQRYVTTGRAPPVRLVFCSDRA